jgi:hypothetical protein
MKIKRKRLVKILRRLENSGIFWLSISLLGFFLFSDPIQNPIHSEIVIEQIRGGAKDWDSFVGPPKPEGLTTGPQDLSNPELPPTGPQDLSNRELPPIVNPRQLDDPKPPNLGIKWPAPPPGASGSGSGSGKASSWEDENYIPPESDWANDPDYWSNYKYNKNDFSKKKEEEEEETCSVSDELQQKANIEDLPDSCNEKYIFSISNKQAKQKVRKLWIDKDFRNTAISMLESIDAGSTTLEQENLQGFNTLKQYKKDGVRIIVVRSKGNEPEKIIAIVPRRDFEGLLKTFKKKYD